MKKSIILFFALLCSFSVSAQIQWQKCLGGTGNEDARSIIQTYDSGYLVAGFTNSNDGDVSSNHGSNDYWVVKLNAAGTIEWQQSLGGTDDEYAMSIVQTFDSGCIVAGYSKSIDGNVTGNHGGYDYWLVKLDAGGAIEWQKSLGGTGYDIPLSIIQTCDSGYLVGGNSSSNDGDVTGSHGGTDYWIVKLNATGNIEWQKTLGGTNLDEAYAIIQTYDSGYAVAGISHSNDGDLTGNHGGLDYWVVKLSSSGIIEWQKSLGGSGDDWAYSIIQTFDSGYVVSGYSNSNDGDVTGNIGFYDYWIVKLNTSGTIQWQKSLGGTGYDRGYSTIQTSDTGYLVTGYSGSFDGDVSNPHGGGDYWMAKLNSSGTIQWQESFGGTDTDDPNSSIQTSDSGYIVAGYSSSNNLDVTGNHGGQDYWIVKLGVATRIENLFSSYALHVYPNPSKANFSISANSEFNNAQLNIFNAMGGNVYSCRLNRETKDIDAEKFSSGIYYLQIIKGEKMWGEKIIKQ